MTSEMEYHQDENGNEQEGNYYSRHTVLSNPQVIQPYGKPMQILIAELGKPCSNFFFRKTEVVQSLSDQA
jgi:hypothetical protein